jgi:hypothetical protein
MDFPSHAWVAPQAHPDQRRRLVEVVEELPKAALEALVALMVTKEEMAV